MWYCFAIDETAASVDEVHRLWRRRNRGAWHRALRANDVAEHAVRSHAAIDASAWWLRYGAGAVVIRPGEDGLDRAVCAFLLEHAELFSRVWYGAVTRSPLDQSLLDHVLVGPSTGKRGEAA